MTKKHFIALADLIIDNNCSEAPGEHYTDSQIEALADFCEKHGENFNRLKWLRYIKSKLPYGCTAM